MKGGKIERNIKDHPTGGFPPIYFCDTTLDENENKNKIIRREFSSKIDKVELSPIISMKEILAKRRINSTTEDIKSTTPEAFNNFSPL